MQSVTIRMPFLNSGLKHLYLKWFKFGKRDFARKRGITKKPKFSRASFGTHNPRTKVQDVILNMRFGNIDLLACQNNMWIGELTDFKSTQFTRWEDTKTHAHVTPPQQLLDMSLHTSIYSLWISFGALWITFNVNLCYCAMLQNSKHTKCSNLY